MAERRRTTVRFRVTALATVALLGVLGATGVALVVTQRRQLVDNLEESMATTAAALADALADGRRPEPLGGFGDDDDVVQLVVDGEVVGATGNLEDAAPLRASADDGMSWSTVDDLPHDDGSFRLLSVHVETPDGPGVVHVAATLEDIDASTSALAASLLVAVPAAAAALAVVVWWVVGRTLRPVEAIRSQVASIGVDDLGRRVPTPGTGDEIDRLACTMNDMLDRIEGSVRRQQRFVADASHELRSPLARMRAELEADLARPSAADLVATQASVLDEAVALQRLVGDLLYLARSDAGAAAPAADGLVDLDVVVRREAERARVEGGSTVDTSAVGAAQVRGDARLLARVVGNVLDNATAHAATAVVVSLEERDGTAELAVADDGSGIPEAERERVFERFARLDEARTAGAGGTGLGLAIARDIVQRHGGTIIVDPTHAPGARIVVQLPAVAGR